MKLRTPIAAAEYAVRYFSERCLAVTADGEVIELLGDATYRVCDTGEREKKHLIALITGQRPEPIPVAGRVEQRAHRLLRWCLKQLQDLLLKRSHRAHPNRSGDAA